MQKLAFSLRAVPRFDSIRFVREGGESLLSRVSLAPPDNHGLGGGQQKVLATYDCTYIKKEKREREKKKQSMSGY